MLSKIRNRVAFNILKFSDWYSRKIFLLYNSEIFIEIGCHQGELLKLFKLNKLNTDLYIGYEANIHNFEKYNLGENILNMAVVPKRMADCREVELKIPVMGNTTHDSLNSGKGSLLDRDYSYRENVEIVKKYCKAISVEEILENYSKLSKKIWIDAEGLSLEIAYDFLNDKMIQAMYVEYDVDAEDQTNIIISILQNFDVKFLEFRTSYDQYNILISKKGFNKFEKLMSFIIDNIYRALYFWRPTNFGDKSFGIAK